MKMTLDQWQLILDTMIKARDEAHADYKRKLNHYNQLREKFCEENPDATDKEVEKGFSREHEAQRAAHEHFTAIHAVILKLENTEI